MIDELSILDMELTIESSEEFDVLCRELTSTDVDQALYTLKVNQKPSRKCTISSDNESLTVLHKEECDCCRLRRSDISSRLLLPLARRGRPHFSTRSHRLLCSNCTEIKRQQQMHILKNEQTMNSNHIFHITINLGISTDEHIALNNHQYKSSQMLVWKINSSDGNTIDLSYDTDSLTENEKKILLEETIKKLQVVLNHRSTTIPDTDQDNSEFTYRTLQTTINILSSSHNSI